METFVYIIAIIIILILVTKISNIINKKKKKALKYTQSLFDQVNEKEVEEFVKNYKPIYYKSEAKPLARLIERAEAGELNILNSFNDTLKQLNKYGEEISINHLDKYDYIEFIDDPGKILKFLGGEEIPREPGASRHPEDCYFNLPSKFNNFGEIIDFTDDPRSERGDVLAKKNICPDYFIAHTCVSEYWTERISEYEETDHVERTFTLKVFKIHPQVFRYFRVKYLKNKKIEYQNSWNQWRLEDDRIDDAAEKESENLKAFFNSLPKVV